MWVGLRRRIEQWAARRRRFRLDARELATIEGRTAYYEAQRRAVRARAQGQHNEFVHWARVAAEIARIAPQAEMDIRVVAAIVDSELGRRGQGPL